MTGAIDVRLGAAAVRAVRDGPDSILQLDDGTSLAAEAIVLATGCQPRTDGLGLGTVGITARTAPSSRSTRLASPSTESSGEYGVRGPLVSRVWRSVNRLLGHGRWNYRRVSRSTSRRSPSPRRFPFHDCWTRWPSSAYSEGYLTALEALQE